MNKHILVKYKNRCGEYEFTSYIILIAKSKRKNEENLIHDFFLTFYGDSSSCNEFVKATSYLYNSYEVGVKIISYNEITFSEYEILMKLNIY